ncbi:MAG: DEAD/DEAH box helicase [Flavobacteriales bacterium]|nr:DEAD/DEAH box helicase [Bacteroidota bacterium]MCB9240784.1 DEAD/DEAH box helicase [Flavobacteriales bacterium]
MKFAEYRIDSRIKSNLDKLGWKKPTDIQYKSIPPILQRQDVLAIAQTGTGKTAAFAIPAIHRLLNRKSAGLGCLVMVPTRELAKQIADVFKELSNGTNLNILAIHGGVEQESQIKQLTKGVDVLVTTPGRMFDLNHQGYINFDRIETLILDEADHMLDLGFIKDIRDVNRLLPQKKQVLFFSATIDDKIKKLAYSIVQNPLRIQISPKDPIGRNIEHSVLHVSMDDKRFFLERVFRENPESKIIVFTRTQVRAERVVKAMHRVELEAECIHSGVEQSVREKELADFRSGALKHLISTDVSARGIDIDGIDLVINYDLPEQPDQYVHRVGRTGRSGKKGVAISFCSPEETELLQRIEHYINRPILMLDLGSDFYEETKDFSKAAEADWRSLLDEEESRPKKGKSK